MAGLALLVLRLNSDNITSKLICLNHKRIPSSRWNILGQENKLSSVQDVTDTVCYEEEMSPVESDNTLEKRDKSRLNLNHRNILHGKPPYQEPIIPYHHTFNYYRKLFGRYGMSSGVNPGILWPTKDELQKKLEYERVAYPDTFQVMVARAKLKSAKELEAIKIREEEINSKAAKLEQWKRELQDRLHKKLKEAQAAKEKKERLLEEVRQHFGFKLDPRDQRFKEMLEKKEKEESKRVKAEKKKMKQAKLLEKLGLPPPPLVALMSESTLPQKK